MESTTKFIKRRLLVRQQLQGEGPFFLQYNLDDTITLFLHDELILTMYDDTLEVLTVRPQINFPMSVEHRVDSEVTELLESLTDSLNRMCNNFETTTAQDVVGNVFAGVKAEVIKSLPIFVLLVFLLQLLVCGGSTRYKMALISALTIYQLSTTKYVSDKLKILLTFTHEHSYPRPQGAIDFEPFAQALSSIVLFMTTGVKSRSAFDFPLIDRIVNLGKTKESFSKGIDSLMTIVHDLCVYFEMDYLSKMLRPKSIYAVEGLEDWVTACDSILNLFHNASYDITRDNYDHLYSTILRGNHLLSESKHKGVYDRIKTTVNAYLHSLRKISLAFEQANFGKGQFRSEPLTILFKGAPGVGKSAATVFFLSDVMKRVISQERLEHFSKHPTDYIYMRKNEHKYWDGYHGQFCTVFDDFGQQRDYAQNAESEYMDLIRVCNTFPHICHMASLENKGNVEFRSNIVLLTTNLETMHVESLNEVEAVLRRIDVMIRVVPKAEFSKDANVIVFARRLDVTKINKVFDKDIYEMHIIDPLTNMPTGEMLSYDELVHHCALEYRRKHQHSGAYLEALLEHLAIKPQGAFDDIDNLEDLENPNHAHDTVDVIQSKIYRTTDLPTIAWPKPVLSHFLHYLSENDPKAYQFLIDCSLEKFPYVLQTIFDSDVYSAYLISMREPGLPARLLQKAKDMFTALKNHIRRVVEDYPILSSIIALTAFVCTTVGIIRAFSDTDVQPHTFSGQEPRFRKSTTTHRRRIGHLARPQMGSQQANDMVTSLITKNVYELVTTDNEMILGNVLILKDRYCLYPKHFYTRMRHALAHNLRPDLKELELINEITDYVYTVPVEVFLNIESDFDLSDLDYCVVNLPTTFRRHRDISRSFINESDIVNQKFPQLRVSLLADKHVNSVIVRGVPETNRKVMGDDGTYIIHKGFSYRAPTRSGDCGALVTLETSGPHAGKIVGFHVAGDSGDLGISNLVTYEDIQAIVDVLPQMGWLANLEGFDHVGLANPTPPSTGSTKIVPSRLIDTYCEHTTTPAHLRIFQCGGESIDPMATAVAKYKYKEVDTNHMFYSAIDQVFTMFRHTGSHNRREYNRILSYKETILGVPGLDFIEPIPRGTSPGYPYNCSGSTFKGKTYWLGTEDEVDTENPKCQELIALCEDVEQEMQQGIEPDFYFSDFLKDERRAIAKVQQGRTRLVSGCPIVLTLITRRYFAGFAGWIMANHVSNGSAVGINVYSRMWHILATRLETVGSNIICGDFSNFDGSLRPEYLEYIGRKISEWYEDDHSPVRSIIWKNVWQSKHVNGKLLYKWKQGLPSGHPLTSIINSIYNLSAIYMLYNTHLSSSIIDHPLDQNMVCIVYGDDNVISLSNEVMKYFSVDTIVECFGTIGLRFTPPTKDVGVLEFGDISQAQFLRRGFRMDSVYCRYLAPLELSVIKETPMWTKRGAYRLEITLKNVEDSLHELSLHSEAVFNTWAPLIVGSAEHFLDYHPLVVDYSSLRQRTIARVERW